MATKDDKSQKFNPFRNRNQAIQPTEDANLPVVQLQNSPPTLAQLETEIKFHISQISQNIIEIGTRLIQAKSLVQHGQWSKWLESNFALTNSTAAKFMKAAKRFGRDSKLVSIPHLNSTQMITLLSLPEADTEKFIKEQEETGSPVENMTAKTLRGKVKTWKQKSTHAVNKKTNIKNAPETSHLTQSEELIHTDESVENNLSSVADSLEGNTKQEELQPVTIDIQTTNTISVDSEQNVFINFFNVSNELLQRTDLKQYITKCASEDTTTFKTNIDNLFKLIDIVQDVLDGK